MLRFGVNAAKRRGALTPWVGRLRLVALAVAVSLVLAAQAQLERSETQAGLSKVVGLASTRPVAVDRLAYLVGVTFDAVRDNTFFRSEEQPAWFAVLEATRADATGDAPAVEVGYAELLSQPDAYRGARVRVRGAVRRVEAVTPAENAIGLDRLYRVTLQPEGGGVWPITVYALEAPPTLEGEGATATADGWFFKNLSYRWADGVGVTPVIVARSISRSDAERPTSVATPPAGEGQGDFAFESPTMRSLGRALLTELGVDLAALDAVEDRQKLTAAERDAFYAVLEAVGETPATQLARLAQEGLADYATRQASPQNETRQARLVAAEVSRMSDAGRYSVAPLFGDGDQQRGELIVVDAVVRRVVRVEVPAAVSDVGSYYELEAFPEDSQNLPLVFCVRDLPTGFPIGEAVRQPARLSGFFFKQWAYRTRKPTAAGGDRRQFAPLLIGRAPIALPTAEPSRRPGLAVGVGGVVLLAASAVWIWRASRTERRYETTTLRRLRDASAKDFSTLT